jgi:hypothetical protein
MQAYEVCKIIVIDLLCNLPLVINRPVHEADHSSHPYSVEVKNEKIVMLNCKISTKTQDTYSHTNRQKRKKEKTVGKIIN